MDAELFWFLQPRPVTGKTLSTMSFLTVSKAALQHLPVLFLHKFHALIESRHISLKCLGEPLFNDGFQ